MFFLFLELFHCTFILKARDPLPKKKGLLGADRPIWSCFGRDTGATAVVGHSTAPEAQQPPDAEFSLLGPYTIVSNRYGHPKAQVPHSVLVWAWMERLSLRVGGELSGAD